MIGAKGETDDEIVDTEPQRSARDAERSTRPWPVDRRGAPKRWHRHQRRRTGRRRPVGCAVQIMGQGATEHQTEEWHEAVPEGAEPAVAMWYGFLHGVLAVETKKTWMEPSGWIEHMAAVRSLWRKSSTSAAVIVISLRRLTPTGPSSPRPIKVSTLVKTFPGTSTRAVTSFTAPGGTAPALLGQPPGQVRRRGDWPRR